MSEQTTEKEHPKPAQSMSELDSDDDIEYATIEGFKAGTTLRIGSLTAGDMIEWHEANEGDAKRTAGLRLICKSLVDDSGNRYAADGKNINVFRRKNQKATQRVVKEILKLNGLDVKGPEEAKNA